MTETWRPQIGERVRVSSTKEWASDWVDYAGKPLEVYVAGVRYDPNGWLDVTVCEQWPPQQPGDLSDGFLVGHPAQTDDLAPTRARDERRNGENTEGG